MSWESRLDQITKALTRLQPAGKPTPIVVELIDWLNPYAASDVERGRPSRFVMVPKGCRAEMPEGIPSFQEWLGDEHAHHGIRNE